MGVVDVERGESGTRPDTISEKSGFSYGDGWGGIAGGLKGTLTPRGPDVSTT